MYMGDLPKGVISTLTLHNNMLQQAFGRLIINPKLLLYIIGIKLFQVVRLKLIKL